MRPPTEARNPHSTHLDVLSTLDLVRLMNAEDRTVADVVGLEASAIASAIDRIASQLRAGGRLFYVGAGTSGRLGALDASECPPTFGVSSGLVVGVVAGGDSALTRSVEGAEDRLEDGRDDLRDLGLGPTDVVVGIAMSGTTPYVLGALDYARGVGAATIGVVANPDTAIGAAVDICIPLLVGPEVLTGSTRLKAGTATKLVLNMLSTGAMVRLGKCYGNLMVDLRATNEKLVRRARGIVQELTEVSDRAATDALARAGGELKTAVVSLRLGVEPDEARRRLDDANGRLRDVIEVRAVTPGDADDALVIGVDGGATKTVAWLAPRGDGAPPLGVGTAGPGNPRSVGFAEAERQVDLAIASAFADAGLARRPVTVAGLALAGAGRADERDRIQAWAERIGIATRVLVTDDVESVLAAGGDGEGSAIALVCGTGTVALGKNAAGAVDRAGGWGYLLGDEGSGYAIATAGLRAAVRAADGRAHRTALTEAFLAHFGVTAPADLVGRIYGPGMTREGIAALAAVVFEAAARDRTAARIIKAASADLVRLVTTLGGRLGIEPGTFALVMAGSVLVQQPAFRASVVAGVRAAGLVPSRVRLVTDPVAGAVSLARRDG
jgi:N-acetylmuramic acid 6-phosphate etherase